MIAAVSPRAEIKQRVYVRCEAKHSTLTYTQRSSLISIIGVKSGRNVGKFALFHFPGPEKKTLCLPSCD